MPSRFKDLCLDASDHQALADWWCAALGYVRQAEETPRPLDWPVPIEDPAGQGPLIWINPVPEPKSVKNRMHLTSSAIRRSCSAWERRWSAPAMRRSTGISSLIPRATSSASSLPEALQGRGPRRQAIQERDRDLSGSGPAATKAVVPAVAGRCRGRTEYS